MKPRCSNISIFATVWVPHLSCGQNYLHHVGTGRGLKKKKKEKKKKKKNVWFLYRKTQSGGTVSGQVFSMSSDRARQILQTSAASVSSNDKNVFGLHSLRIGGATVADAAGHTLGEIRLMGRWRSACVLQYLRSVEEIHTKWGTPRPRGMTVVPAFSGSK